MKRELELEGIITIGRQTGPSGILIHLQIEDVLSGCRIADLEMNVEDYGHAISGLAGQPCRMKLYPKSWELLGRTRENKTEDVCIPGISGGQRTPTEERLVEEAVKPFEVDGWKADTRNVGNHHYWRRDDVWSVMFFRYVSAETKGE